MNREEQKINIDFSKTSEVICEKCKNDTFTQIYKMRKLSKLLSPTGQETMLPVQVFACVECNHINPMFLPNREFEDDNESL
tara:strand:+ start:223 stop:465 length:243 start_codon:yes stop_codon:yes gene_type:complete